MQGLKYVGPVWDRSGYAEACRNYIFSLYKRGVPLTVHPQCFENDAPPISNQEHKEILDELVHKDIPYDTLLIHLTPDLYPRFTERNKYNIGFTAWETTLLHPKWISCCNNVDEMWVPSEVNVKALKDSGVTVPIHKVPHGIDPDTFDAADKNFSVPGVPDDVFKFYAIFQWIIRKNPEGLLRAYFNAFKDTDNVALIIKSYMVGSTGRERNFIKDKILWLKKDFGLSNLPKIYFIGDTLSREQLLGLHLYGDCLVSLHKGEGWGLIPFEAGLAGKPVIATGWGGNTDFMDKENSYLVDYQMEYTHNMSGFNPWYLGYQQQALPNLPMAVELMREVFNNREEACTRGAKLRENIKTKFSWETVSDIIINRFSEI